jgi:hypothetical protein
VTNQARRIIVLDTRQNNPANVMPALPLAAERPRLAWFGVLFCADHRALDGNKKRHQESLKPKGK